MRWLSPMPVCPAITAGVVAYPHSEVLRAEDLFTLAEAALAQGKSNAPDRVGVADPGGAPPAE